MSKADPVALTRDLVRCPSVTPAEGGALGVLAKALGGAGFTVHRMTFSDTGTPDVENFYARIGDRAPHLMFAGHTDVVPAGNESAWTHPPFAGGNRDGLVVRPRGVGKEGGHRSLRRPRAQSSRGKWRKAEGLDLVPD